MRVVVFHILPNYPNAVHVQWNLENVDPARIAGVTFNLQRSGSPRGEWETRAEGLTSVFHTDVWADGAVEGGEEENLLSVQREYWYRVQAVLADGEILTSHAMDNDGLAEPRVRHEDAVGLVVEDDQLYSDPNSPFTGSPRMRKRLQLIRRSQIRNALINLEKFSGANMAVLKRRHFGTRCSACTAPVIKEVLVSNCATCYGTGWVGGYFPPFQSTGRFIEAPVATNLETEGYTHMQRAQLSIINFPRLEKDDVVVELDTNRRWVVTSMSSRTLKRIMVTQDITVSELARTSVEYRVPVELGPPKIDASIEGG